MIYAGKRKVLDAYLGTTKVHMMMLGDAEVYNTIYSVTCILDGVTSNAPSTVEEGASLSVLLTEVGSNKVLENSVVVTMGGVDITSTAYNHATRTITIASVTGDVSITASAIAVIIFADPAVKVLCVTNWGGNAVEGEITEGEAAAVTSLGGMFRGNTNITSFDELRFFTGLTGFTQGSNGQGEFYGCSALKSIKFPSLNITTADWRGLLRGCNALESVDLSPVKASRYYIYYFVNLATTSKLTEITIPGGSYGSGSGGTTYARNAFNGCKQMTTLNIDGTADFSAITSFQTDAGAYLAFGNCTSLTTITGTMAGIKADLNMGACPLTADSAMVILNGLADLTGQTGKTLTLSSTTKSALTAAGIDYTAIATAKNWNIPT